MERISSGGLETELRLGLPGGEVDQKNEKKRVFSDLVGGEGEGEEAESKLNGVVGWPPVAGFRRKSGFGGGKRYVKVSMDGAPFLRKVDLDLHKGYSQLVKALEHLFGCYGGGGIAAAAAAGEVKLDEENTSNSEYVGIYQDKDGDWMLLGDVPWQMFTESCKRLRIMKRADANGHAKDLLKGLSKQDY